MISVKVIKILVHNVFKSCVINFSIERNLLVFLFINAKLCVPIVTLSIEDDVKLTKQLGESFTESVYWNQYKMEIKTKEMDNINPLRMILDASFQGVKNCLFLLLMILLMMLNRLKEPITKTIFFKNKYNQIQRIN